MNRHPLGPQLGLVALLTLGVGLVWGLVAAFSTAMWERHLSASSRQTLYERLTVTAEGTPLIEGYSYANSTYQELPLRTLTGEPGPAKLDQGTLLTYASFPTAPRPRRWHDAPLGWPQRLVWASDEEPLSPTTWYLIRDDGDLGLSYLAGFDSVSRLGIGFIGRNGFRGSPPLADERFALGPGPLLPYGGGSVVGTRINGVTRSMSRGPGAIPPGRLYLIDGPSVVEVNLPSKRVRTVFESPQLVSLGIMMRPLAADDPAAGERPAQKITDRLGIRTTDSIVVLNPSPGDEKPVEFTLPEKFRQARELMFYMISNDSLLRYQPRPSAAGSAVRLTWLNRQGETVDEKSLELAGYVPLTPRARAVVDTIIAPAPIAAATMLFGISPFMKLQAGDADSYGDALRQSFAVAWPPALVLLLISIVAAWLAARWQRQEGRRHAPLWTVAIFLFGLPGLAAYLLHFGRHYPAARRQSLPEPALTGAEIFA